MASGQLQLCWARARLVAVNGARRGLAAVSTSPWWGAARDRKRRMLNGNHRNSVSVEASVLCRLAGAVVPLCLVVSGCSGADSTTATSRERAVVTTRAEDGSLPLGPLSVATKPPEVFDAVQACTEAVPDGFEFFNAAATVVNDVREFGAGPPGNDGQPSPLWPDAFPAAGATDPAAWCTASDGNGTYAIYVVSPDQPTLDLGRQSLAEPPPPGPPRIE